MDMDIKRSGSLALLVLMLGTPPSVEAQWRVTPEALIGLDHMPFVVQDLEAATILWQDMGFAVQPGGTQDNGITTANIVFKEGASIELFSVPAAVDELTEKYRAMLDVAEGPTSFYFRARDLGAAREGMEGDGFEYMAIAHQVDRDSMDYLYFREGVPDEDKYLRHPNGARVMSRVWVATTRSHGRELKRLLAALTLGADTMEGKFYAPGEVQAISVAIDNGEVLILPIDRQVTEGRPVVGATIEVENVEALRNRLMSAGIAFTQGGTFRASVIVSPETTHGMWLEFRE